MKIVQFRIDTSTHTWYTSKKIETQNKQQKREENQL